MSSDEKALKDRIRVITDSFVKGFTEDTTLHSVTVCKNTLVIVASNKLLDTHTVKGENLCVHCEEKEAVVGLLCDDCRYGKQKEEPTTPEKKLPTSSYDTIVVTIEGKGNKLRFEVCDDLCVLEIRPNLKHKVFIKKGCIANAFDNGKPGLLMHRLRHKCSVPDCQTHEKGCCKEATPEKECCDECVILPDSFRHGCKNPDCPCHQVKLPISSYEVTCGRCEKSFKHSCGRV